MALTAEQQFQMDLETARHNNMLATETKRAKLEAVRLAKETLLENARSKPIDSRDVSAADIANFAQSLVNFIET